MDIGSDTTVEALRDHAKRLSDGRKRPAEGAVSGGEWGGESGTDLFSALDSGAVTGEGRPTVVGLGEATHGTRECFEVKSRLIRRLVERGVVRTVAFEVDVTATLALDAVVRRGEGTPESALGDLDRWMWQSESVRDLLAWLQSFNRDRPANEKVRVRGIDLGEPGALTSPLRAYFEDVDPDWGRESDALATLENLSVPGDAGAREDALAAAERAAAVVERRLERHRGAYLDAATEERWKRARHLCRVVHRACDWHRVRHEHPGPHAAGMETRDRHMAANVEWCVEQDPRGGVAVWAHNSHVKRGTFDDGQPWTDATTMGERLARALGDDYTPVGFDIGRGTFRAVGTDDPEGGPRRFTVGPPREDSATALFEAVGEAPWLLDLVSAARDTRLQHWLDQPRRIRWVGTVYDPDAPEEHYLRTDLMDFDALVFVKQSTPSRPVT